MKIRTTYSLVVIFTCFLFPLVSSAQDSTSLKTRPFQITFITPLGTNGLEAWNIRNRFSVNILAGYSGGLDGAEFSGLFSLLRKEMRGVQFAGLGNIVLKNCHGAQFAGYANTVIGSVNGIQVAGFSNVGIGSANGAQFSGFGNIITQAMSGMQVAGYVNYARGGKVSQLGGFANISTADQKGFQLAGYLNLNSGNMKGAQIAGFFNFARKLSGIQIAPFNYTDSLEKGIPIGVFSVVRNGYHAVELSANESLFGVLSVKSGVKPFYNILSSGIAYRNDEIIWGWGYGLGGMFPVSSRWDLAVEGLCYQVNEGEWFTDRLNLLNKINLDASVSLSSHVSLIAGLSWNVTVSDITDEYGETVESHIAPFWVMNETYDDRINVKMYPGANLGLSFKF